MLTKLLPTIQEEFKNNERKTSKDKGNDISGLIYSSKKLISHDHYCSIFFNT